MVSSRTHNLIVKVVGMEGTFHQVAKGQRRTRVKPVGQMESFLVDNSLVTPVNSVNPEIRLLPEAAKGLRRAIHNGVEVIVLRRSRIQSRVALPGGTTSFLVKTYELSGHYDFVSAIQSDAEALTTLQEEEVVFMDIET